MIHNCAFDIDSIDGSTDFCSYINEKVFCISANFNKMEEVVNYFHELSENKEYSFDIRERAISIEAEIKKLIMKMEDR